MGDTEQEWPQSAESLAESERLRNQARGAMSSGNFEHAATLLRRAIDLHPASINFDLLGQCLLRLGRPREGITFLAAAAGLGHNQFKSRVNLAQALYALGSDFHLDALWQLEEALRVNPAYGKARALLEEWLQADPSLREHLHPSTQRG